MSCSISGFISHLSHSPPIMTVLRISANPGTDIWRKPPHTNVFNGTPPLTLPIHP